mmetsp:Transcript_17441/g.43491  ORF Transcript_17441/g.43491 Transcript_17441/m.43491 type:complete len:131 (-) Transcript_17441:1307-1699(-)
MSSFAGGYLSQFTRQYAPQFASVMTKIPVFGPVFTSMGHAYQANIDKNLKKYGLKYDDLLIEDEDVTAAVDKLNSSEFSNRNKRIKRAMDLGLKHKYLNAESQAKVEPFVGYLQTDKVRAQRIEREILSQ